MKAFETWYKLHLRTVVLPSIEFLIISLLIIVFYYFYMWLRMFLPPVVHKTVQVNTLMTYIVDEVSSIVSARSILLRITIMPCFFAKVHSQWDFICYFKYEIRLGILFPNLIYNILKYTNAFLLRSTILEQFYATVHQIAGHKPVCSKLIYVPSVWQSYKCKYLYSITT